MSQFADKHYLVLGLARSGTAALAWLQEQGASAVGWDDDPKKRKEAAKLGFSILDKPSLDGKKAVTALIQSPGIPFGFPFSIKTHELTEGARNSGIPVFTDLNLLREAFPESTFVGVTGTNGKSTTVSLVHYVLQNQGKMSALGGNIGRAALDLPPSETYVLELSSFQLALSRPLRLDVAGWLNISEDHLDVHGTMKAYSDAKGRLLLMNPDPREGVIQSIVMGIDDSFSSQLCERLRNHADKRLVPVAVKSPQAREYAAHNQGITVEEGLLTDWNFVPGKSFSLKEIASLRGTHNHQNAAVAYGMLKALGLSPEAIADSFKTFPGLAHRQEIIREMKLKQGGSLSFINDSKATNAKAVSQAFEALVSEFDHLYWIAGGKPKSEGIISLASNFSKIEGVYLIGEAQESFAETLQKERSDLPVNCVETLEAAVREAYAQAIKDIKAGEKGLILLSPACASYDQFKDFEDRGNAFKKHVRRLS